MRIAGRLAASPVLFRAVVAAGVFLVGCHTAALTGLRIDRVDPAAGGANLRSLGLYWTTSAGLWGVLTLLAWLTVRAERGGGGTSEAWPVRERWRVGVSIVVVAAAARVVVASVSWPQLSDDVWRYIHDGRQLVGGVNPYAYSPAEVGAGSGADPIVDQINHPDMVTIYQPVSQWVFAALWWARPAGVDPWGVGTFRLGFAAIDLGIVLMLLWVLWREGRSPWWAALYAWHPLVIGEVAGSGHQDVIGIALLMGAVVLVGGGRPGWRRVLGGGVLWAGSVAVKPVGLLLALPVIWGRGWRWREAVVGAIAAGGMLMALYLPFVLMDGGLGRLFETTCVFVERWGFNSPIHKPVELLVGSRAWANVVAGGVLMAVWVGCLVRRYDPWRAGRMLLLAALLVSSTVHPWYLLWALALLPTRFEAGLWVLSLTIGWSYAVLGDVMGWELPGWVLMLEYLPVAVIGVAGMLRQDAGVVMGSAVRGPVEGGSPLTARGR
jgi:hypothetical protein